jgi:hypothetical protein
MALKSMEKELASDRLTLATVCTDPHNNSDLERIVADLQMDLPVLLDENADLFRRLRLRGVPSTVLVGPDGRVVSVHYGYSPGLLKQVKARVMSLLETEVAP